MITKRLDLLSHSPQLLSPGTFGTKLSTNSCCKKASSLLGAAIRSSTRMPRVTTREKAKAPTANRITEENSTTKHSSSPALLSIRDTAMMKLTTMTMMTMMMTMTTT